MEQHPAPAAHGVVEQARRQWQAQGQWQAELLSPPLQARWQRSLAHGLAPVGASPAAPHASGAQLNRAQQQQAALLAQARPVMAFLGEQVRGSRSLVILADAQGMLLDALGDDGFADRAARVALRPGAIWAERWRGTNAIGTALAEEAPVVVHAAEHYLQRNGFLTCAAAPVAEPGGGLAGVLDISGERRSHHPHTLGLVRAAACMLEHQLFMARHSHGLLLRLHAQPEGLGTVTEGLLALSASGLLIGANRAARAWLGLPRSAIGLPACDCLPGSELLALAEAAGAATRAPRRLRLEGGLELWCSVQAEQRVGAGVGSGIGASPAAGRSAPAAPATDLQADALARLDSGDPTLRALLQRARRVLDKPIALLLQGESGVGKELFARACHDSSARSHGPFVAVNCAALPETLIEAELFGYRPGAFTGAARDGACGRLREAHGGTLFLDEIGDMPLAMQARLLRVLQERQVVPLGGGKPVAVDFQLICATHHRLADAVAAGRFREDLYYRLNGLSLALPPLRERSDLAALVARMLAELTPARALRLAPEVAAAFAAYPWPGNLRQLANALRTACALVDDTADHIGFDDLPEDLAQALRADTRAAPAAPAGSLRAQAQRSLADTLQAASGNRCETARRLGISHSTLYRRLREQGSAS